MKVPKTPPTLNLHDLDALARLAPVLARSDGLPDAYLHWDALRYRTPPEGLTPQEYWFALKVQRRQRRRSLPLRALGGVPHTVTLTDEILRQTHHLDQQASGQVAFPEPVTGPSSRDRYIVSSLIEEAITSSQLEGAATTREVAKEMLRAGRSPRNADERMIVNNLRAMEAIRPWRTEPFTPDRVLALHRVVTEGTFETSGPEGRLRPGDDVRVMSADGQVLHTPPPAAELPERLETLCRFANGELDGETFIPPVVRAILVHYQLAYDHPFEDGNGRTARALFYWSLLREGYWLFEYVSISRLLRKSPAQYATAFLLTETDEGDTTYFVHHQLDILRRAMDDLRTWLARKAAESKQIAVTLRDRPDLNHRQRDLLAYALKKPETAFTVHTHQVSHSVAYATARADLLGLVDAGLLIQVRSGRGYTYVAEPDLEARLNPKSR